MKVMVVDEADIRTYLMTVLEDSGYEACTVEEGNAVEEGILKEKPDLIILDIMMPRRSGISILTVLPASDSK